MQTQMIEAYPLTWPVGYPRTKWPQYARFDTTFAAARDAINREIKLLGGRDVIISSNVPLRRDGLPYANFSKIEDNGVAVYFMYQKEQVVFACDKWKMVKDNMQAIRKAIEAVRGLDRWGVSEMLKRAFTGFKAIPEQTTGSAWWDVLQCTHDASVEIIKAQYKRLAMDYHPDKNNGDSSKFYVLKTAYDQAINQFKNQ